ncbi:hypothetical protein HZB88_03030 [archaeon]|nr:hypothetical protein [archaeon]
MPDIHEMQELEYKLGELFTETAIKLKGHKSMQLMRDNDFGKIREREVNNVHLFLELTDVLYFHLKADLNHMKFFLEQVRSGEIFLTGYLKDSVAKHGGEHAFSNQWYRSDALYIAQQIAEQNPSYFSVR